MPVRRRLTAWYVLVLAGVLATLGLFVVTRLRADLVGELDGSLGSAATQIAGGYRAEGRVELRDRVATLLPGPRDRGSGAQLLVAPGRVSLADGDPVTGVPLIDRATFARVRAGARVRASLHRGSPSEHLRTVAIPVTRRGRREVLVVAESLHTVDASVSRTAVLLLVGSAAGLVLAAVGGWWLARKALGPVEAMASRADRIGIDELGERIPAPPADDELGHLARTLNGMLARLEAGVEARERLIADASHELRSPLAAMRAELEVSLRHDAMGPAARAGIERARAEVLRMGRIVENLLTLARVDEGGLELLRRPQDLLEIARRGAAARAAAARAAGRELVVEGEPVTVAADRDRIDQVVANLLDNALRFAAGEVRVTVHGGGEARLVVADDGPGVPVEVRDRVFDRFWRADAARDRSAGGVGLGLAICAEIVHAHGGRIWVEDRAGSGSAFVVVLPVAETAPEAATGGRSERKSGEANVRSLA